MKKVLAAIVALAMLSTLCFGVLSNADSQAVDQSWLTLTERFSDDFSGGSLSSDDWMVDTPPSVTEDGKLQLGGAHWINNGYLAFVNDELSSDYVFDSVISGTKNDCYWGIVVRTPKSGNNPQNGGRFGVPSPAETTGGLCFDIMIKSQDGKMGVTFCNGGPNSEAPAVLFDAPEGFDPTADNNYRIVDTGDKITLYINGSEVITIVFDADFEAPSKATVYAADGSVLMAEADVGTLGSGVVGFYQRNNIVHVDNVVISDAVVTEPAPVAGGLRDFSKEKGDALSYDWILINGEKVADGNEEVIAKKQLIDGSDESVNTIGMRGWYGNANSKVASYGYMIDDNDPVYGEFKVEAEDAVIAAGGDSRFVVTVDVSELKDGETHKIRVVAKLENGDIVILNRNESGKDRDIYVNYKAPASQTAPETDEPAPQTDEPAPQTGDATVAMFAVVLVAVMGAAVVFSKKRAF